MKSLWSRSHLWCSLPSPAVAFQQLMASFEHQSLSLLVLCMKYYDFDSITLCLSVHWLPLASSAVWASKRELNSGDGNSKDIVKWQDHEALRTGTSPGHVQRGLIHSCGGECLMGINPSGLWFGLVTATGGARVETGLPVTVTSHM